MSSRYDGSRGAATHLLKHYFRLVAERAGVQWDSDNDTEVEAIVDGIITASVQQVTGTVLKSAMCPACGVRVAGASGLCSECTQEAGRLSYAYQAIAARQQEDARIDAVPDAIDAAPQFMQDAYSHMQEARAALWTADTDSGIAQIKDALDSVMSDLETYAQVLAGAREAQRIPVPVSAIAYVMADIAPADAADAQKLHESRAAITAWLESLEAEED